MGSIDSEIRVLAEREAKSEIEALKAEWGNVITEIENKTPTDDVSRFLFRESGKPAPLRIIWKHCLNLIAEHQTEVFVEEMAKKAAQRLLELVSEGE